MNPWDRQDGETETAWRAFVVYRDAPARSLPRDPDGLKMAKSHAWVSRCRAWDAYWDEYRQEARKAAISEAETEMADLMLQASHALVKAGLHELEAIRRRQAMSPDGSAELMTAKDAQACVEKGAKLYLLLQGKPTERSEVQTQVKDLSLEELDAHIAKLERLGK